MKTPDWQTVPFESLAAHTRNAFVGGPFGSNLVSKDYTAEGVPVIRGQNMGPSRWISGEFVFVSQEKAESLKANLASPGDVVFTQRGTLGQVAIIRDGNWERYLISQSQMKATINPALADPLFIYYFFTNRVERDFIISNAIQTGVPHTNLTQLRGHPVLLPSLSEQRAIAEVLGSLDDKIEQNRKTSEVLERLARTIFRAWFVDFEPVKAKATGAASFPGMPQPIFDALPTRLTASEIGPIPEGWVVGALKKFALISKDQLTPGAFPEEVFEHFSLPAFDSAMTPVLHKGEDIKSNKFSVSDGCILFSKLNPRIPRVWLPSPAKSFRQIASTEFLVFEPAVHSARHYLYCQFQDDRFRDELSQGATGTSNSHQRVRPNDVLTKEVVCPPIHVRTEFAALADPLFAKIAANRIESQKLAQMRDYLLPKLLSGEVSVREAEQSVEYSETINAKA